MSLWPAVTGLGFVALNALIVWLGTSVTARYEFEATRTDGPFGLASGSAGVGAEAAAKATQSARLG